jgi:FAD/FMN-containing dehydrogenase/Fe-S oxidoreductase
MMKKPTNALDDLSNELQKNISGEVSFDETTRLLYSTDASIYQIEPIGVVFPRSLDELSTVVEIAAKYRVPILPRGSGSSLAGQAIGEALIIDCSRYLNKQIVINPEERSAIVGPGVIMTELNQRAEPFCLQFGPDPASAERATMGGSIASNATGAHSILYGMSADHLVATDVLLADGSLAHFEAVTLQDAEKRAGLWLESTDKQEIPREMHSNGSIESRLYAAALHIRQNFSTKIQENWPRTWRRSSGYNLNYLLPWAASRPPQWSEVDGQKDMNYPPIPRGYINLAPLVAGSEGTLAIIRSTKVRLVPLPHNTVLGVLSFDSLEAACDAASGLLDHHPSAIELIPKSIIELARSVPAYARDLTFIEELNLKLSGSPNHTFIPEAILIIEFSGEDKSRLVKQVLNLSPNVLVAQTREEQEKIWSIRKVGLGILLSRPGDIKPVAFIEDLSVPVEKLGTFVRGLEEIMDSHDTRGDFYAHASAGCLHIRPLLNLKTNEGVKVMRQIAEQAVSLTLELGGAVSGEHGNGSSRSEWMELAYGSEILTAFRMLKDAADPKGILNPGKILDPQAMDTNLRYGSNYHPIDLTTEMDFTHQAGFIGAVELCNGAGVCRKADGLMCPSYQVTSDEMHSTRGRANLLRGMLSGIFSSNHLGEQKVFEALDLCLACKGCKAECPSAVDMAKIKYEFLNHYYGSSEEVHRRPWRDYLFAYIGPFARVIHRTAPLVNRILRNETIKKINERWLAISSNRNLPPLASHSLIQKLSEKNLNRPGEKWDCLFLSDPFTEYFQPEVGLKAIEVLEAVGYQVEVIPVIGTGRTLISKGFLKPAHRQAIEVVKAIQDLDPKGNLPIIGVEPSEIYSLRDEYIDLLPDNQYVHGFSDRIYMIDEFLIRPGVDGKKPILRIGKKYTDTKVLLHGHCYQKSQPPAKDGYPNGVIATEEMLRSLGYEVTLVDSGCCGMAGAFGYESEHYDISMKIGELKLFPAIRNTSRAGRKVIVTAPGFSCQTQIKDGTGEMAVHPVMLIGNV